MIATELLKGYSDPTRLRVLHLLACRGPELCVCDLVATLELPQGTVSRHLMQLRMAGIVHDRRAGVWMHYSLVELKHAMHRALLQGLRTSAADEPQLAADLERFDALHGMRQLACCSDADRIPAPCCDSTKPGKKETRKP